MAFRQFGLKLERPVRERTRFVAAFRCRLEGVKNPALQARTTGRGEREVRIELEGALVELLGLLELGQILYFTVEIVGLDEREIRFAVLGRLARHLRFFAG